MRDRSGIPFFFKLWFAFVAILALTIMAGSLYFIYVLVSNPEAIGEYVGLIAKGFSQVQPGT